MNNNNLNFCTNIIQKKKLTTSYCFNRMFGVLLISLCYIFMIGSIVFWVYKEVFPKHVSLFL